MASVGRAQRKSDECETGSTEITANCTTPYYGQSQCVMSVAVPGAPAAPWFLCGTDFTCPANFECEQEESTGAVACVEHRNCVEPGAGNGGGGSGGRRGGR